VYIVGGEDYSWPPIPPEESRSGGKFEQTCKRKIAEHICQRPPDEQAKVWPYILARVAREINATWHLTIQDVPFRVLKGRFSGDFQYPSDEEFFEEERFSDDDVFGDDDLLSESSNASEKQARPVRQPDEESVDIGNTTVSPEPEISFSARLDIGCTLSRIREETRLNALEATERMIANNTRYRFRVSEERVQRFSVGDTVIFKDPEGVPAKEKQNAKILSNQEMWWAL